MMASLTGMDVSNASLYDGASALAEAALMAVRQHKSSRRILIPQTVHPVYRRVVRTIVRNQAIEVVEVPYDPATGQVTIDQLDQFAQEEFAALIIPQPNFFGVLEQVDMLADWAHDKQSLAIAVVNPTALAMLKPPGEWGRQERISLSEKVSPWVFHSPVAGPILVSWPANRSWYDKCRGGLSGGRPTWKARKALP